MLRFLTAGESHGPALTTIIDGMPAGVPISETAINTQLARRKVGYGRGGRMKIESDTARILSGVRFGRSLGSPIAVLIENRDWANWTERMRQFEEPEHPIPAITTPRPGHADLPGMIKYDTDDLRDILERASARETAARVAAGAVARCMLDELGVHVFSHVLSIGPVVAQPDIEDLAQLEARAEQSDVRCADDAAAEKMREAIRSAAQQGDTLGGVVQIIATGLPVGLGSHVQWDRRLDGILAGALMSIPAIKGVEFGLGFEAARLPGSQVHDPMYPSENGIVRKTNHAGGLEGGITNGEPLVMQVAMKPIPTLTRSLPSVDVTTGGAVSAHAERSDVCAVPAAGVVAEAMAVFVLSSAILGEICGDSFAEICVRYAGRKQHARDMFVSERASR
ncbi:MAG TPA: chorismate synthase [Armatimonadota bacterium]|nr:chorismate synthase [Armatimonadota bacterium]